jgi:hypothetical protein
MVSTTCVLGFPCAVLTVVKRPVMALLPMRVLIAITTFLGLGPAFSHRHRPGWRESARATGLQHVNGDEGESALRATPQAFVTANSAQIQAFWA